LSNNRKSSWAVMIKKKKCIQYLGCFELLFSTVNEALNLMSQTSLSWQADQGRKIVRRRQQNKNNSNVKSLEKIVREI